MFGLFETSRTLGEPITTFFVRYGAGLSDYYAFTDAEKDLLVAGVTYKKAQIKAPDEITASGTLDKQAIEVRTPVTNPMTEIFRAYPPDSVATMRIALGHAGDPDLDFKTIWQGRILNLRIEGNESIFTCEPVGTSLKRVGLRRCYIYGCPHLLYGSMCRAYKAAATVSAAVSSVSGSTVVLAEGWYGSFDPSKFANGTMEWQKASGTNVVRTALQIGSDHRSILLSGLPVGLASGSIVNMVLGCNHQMDDCADLHNNINNFGGCPWIPTQNPVGSRNNFY